jgi:hypothetical protein
MATAGRKEAAVSRNTDYYQSVPHGGQDGYGPGLDPYGPGLHPDVAVASKTVKREPANQGRANLIAEQARSTSLKRLRSFNHRVQAASAAVQTEMNLILKAIDAPPQAD